MKVNKVLLALGIASAITTSACADNFEYTPDWESLLRHQAPEWFEDAKFGLAAK